jgi:hypothetical protein
MNDKKQNVTEKHVNDNKKYNLHIINSNNIKENNKKDNKDNKYNKVINALMDKDNENNNIDDINKDNKKENEKRENFFKYNFENSEKINSMKDIYLIKNTIGQENIQPMNKYQNKRNNNIGKNLYEINQDNKLMESKEEEEKDIINTNEKKEEEENLENIRKIQKGELDLTYNFDDDVYNVTQEQMGILDEDVNKIYNKYKNVAKLKQFKIKHPYFQNNVKMINNNIEFIIPRLSNEEKKKRISPIIEKQKLILEKIKKNNISRSNLSLSNNISNINTNNHTRNVINRTNRIMYPYTLNQSNNNSNGNEYNNTNTNNNININKYDNNHNTINNNYRYNDNIMSYKNQDNIQRYQNIFNYAPLSSENGSNDYLILNKMNRRKVIYEPYTLIEYKKKYENMNRNGKKLGGLGANLGGEEWIKRQKLMERKKQYSDYVKNDNDEDFKKLNKRKLKTKSDNYAITNTISSKKTSELSHDRLSEPIHKRYNIIKTESNVGKSKPIILPLIKERFVNKSQKNNYKINLKRNIGNNHNNNNEKYKINENKLSMDGIYQNNGNEKDLKELIKQYEEYNGKW